MLNKIIALDIGSVRVGVSISDALGVLAHPLTTLKWVSKEVLLEDVSRIVAEKKVNKVVVGVPYTLKGTDSEQTTKIKSIISYLQSMMETEIVTIDERLTTKMAETLLKETGKKASKNRHIIDQIAAVNILQTYLDKTRI